MTPISKDQWRSIGVNTLLAFISTVVTTLSLTDKIDQAAIVAALVAGLMAALKIVQKLFTTGN